MKAHTEHIPNSNQYRKDTAVIEFDLFLKKFVTSHIDVTIVKLQQQQKNSLPSSFPDNPWKTTADSSKQKSPQPSPL